MDGLASLPRDTAYIRQLLFDLPLPFSLSRANYNLFWPLIDNIYSIRTTSHVTSQSRDNTRHYVICRFKRTINTAPSSSLGPRASTTKRIQRSCNAAFRLVKFNNHVEFHVTGAETTAHDHSLDESDSNKRNSFLLGLVRREIAKGYSPAAIIGALRGNGQSELRNRLAAAGGTYLSRQDVINSGASWRLANPNALFASRESKDVIEIQAREAFETLDKLNWVSSPIQAVSTEGVVGQGIVFAHPMRVGHLTQYGHLTLIDSTHKTNQLEWKLFTLMVRDSHACWIPIAHALLSNEFGELIAQFLLTIKKWVTWNLRFVLSDDSSAEIKAVRLAFPGLVAGETEVSYSVC